MIIKKLFLAICAICLFSIHCVFADEEAGKIVFDCYYLNVAWGYELYGIYIDWNGQIHKYNRNKNPWLPESVGKGAHVHPESELMGKYLNDELVGKIDKKILDKKIQLIKPAAAGNISRKHVAFDAGERSCLAYLYDKSEKSYRQIILGSKGDDTVINSASEAQELYQWLQDYYKSGKLK